MASSDINLLQTKTTNSLFGRDSENVVRIITIVVLSVTFVFGILAGSAYVLLDSQQKTLEQTKNQFTTVIKEYQEKESMLVATTSRLSLIQQIIKTQRSYAPYIDTTIKILAPSYRLSSFSVGKDNTVNMTVDVNSISEAVDMLRTVLTMQDDRMITNLVLNSFSLDNQGKISVSISYTVIL